MAARKIKDAVAAEIAEPMQNVLPPAPPVQGPSTRELFYGIEPKDGQYWVGCVDNAPVYCVHLAGIDFPNFTDPPQTVGRPTSREIHRDRQRGDVKTLTKEQVRACLTALKLKWVHWTAPKHQKGEIRSELSKFMRPDPKVDIPLAQYVFLVPLEATSGPFWRKDQPETLEPQGPRALKAASDAADEYAKRTREASGV